MSVECRVLTPTRYGLSSHILLNGSIGEEPAEVRKPVTVSSSSNLVKIFDGTRLIQSMGPDEPPSATLGYR